MAGVTPGWAGPFTTSDIQFILLVSWGCYLLRANRYITLTLSLPVRTVASYVLNPTNWCKSSASNLVARREPQRHSYTWLAQTLTCRDRRRDCLTRRSPGACDIQLTIAEVDCRSVNTRLWILYTGPQTGKIVILFAERTSKA